MLKGQSDIISAIIIIVIAIGLVGTAYTWGLPLIQKQQDTALAERVTNYFSNDNTNSIQKKIVSVATNGGEATFTEDVSGFWQLVPNGTFSIDNNSLSFTFFSRVSNVATGVQWVPLNGVSCPAPSGSVGEDPYAVCARADLLSNGYNITYKVQFRALQGSDQGYEIYLLQHPSGLLTSTAKLLRIQKGDSKTVSVNGQNLIITEVKILLG
jgi:hypothetical protein